MTALSLTLDGSISQGLRSVSIRSMEGRSVSCKYVKPTNRMASSISFETNVLPRKIVLASLKTIFSINEKYLYIFFKNEITKIIKDLRYF